LDEDVTGTPDASIAHADLDERVPLSEVSANAADQEPEVQEPKAMAPLKRTKSKRGGAKKGAKAKKAQVEEEEEEQGQVVLEDERQAAGSPASDAAADDLAGVSTDGTRFRVRCILF
jgi:hypothetical protein